MPEKRSFLQNTKVSLLGHWLEESGAVQFTKWPATLSPTQILSWDLCAWKLDHVLILLYIYYKFQQNGFLFLLWVNWSLCIPPNSAAKQIPYLGILENAELATVYRTYTFSTLILSSSSLFLLSFSEQHGNNIHVRKTRNTIIQNTQVLYQATEGQHLLQ